MSIPPITDDFLLVDGLQPVTITLRDGTAVYTEVNAHRSRKRRREHVPAGGDVMQGDTIWQFPINTEYGEIPLGSLLIDQYDEEWTILKLDRTIFSSKWEAECRNLNLQAGLDLTVFLESAEYLKDNYGEPLPHWSLVANNIGAKVQLETSTNVIDADAFTTSSVYRITLARSLTITPGVDYRITDQNGIRYAVQSYHQPNRIDALPYVLAKQVQSLGPSSGLE